MSVQSERGYCSERARHLHSLIDRLAARLTAGHSTECPVDDGGDGALLYLGNVHDAVPRALLFDSLLGAVDIVTWQAIRIHAGSRSAARFPSYQELTAIVKVSRPTLGRAITTLRVVRWLSLIRLTKRDEKGRITLQRSIYALHDERISVADAIYIDPGYLALITASCRNRYPPLAKIACLVQQQLETLLPADVSLRRIAGEESVTWIKDFNTGGHPEEKRFPTVALEQKNSGSCSVKNVDSSEVQRVSEQLGPTTTTTKISHSSPGQSAHETSIEPGLGREAEWPEPLLALLHYDDRQIEYLNAELQVLAVPDAQAVIDEAAGALAAKVRRGEPVDNPAGYILALIRRARAGEFRSTQYAQVGCAMRFERAPVSFDPVFEGESGTALAYAWTGRLPASIPVRDGGAGVSRGNGQSPSYGESRTSWRNKDE